MKTITIKSTDNNSPISYANLYIDEFKKATGVDAGKLASERIYENGELAYEQSHALPVTLQYVRAYSPIVNIIYNNTVIGSIDTNDGNNIDWTKITDALVAVNFGCHWSPDNADTSYKLYVFAA